MEKIFSELIGLAGATYNEEKTEDTNEIVLKALAFPVSYPKDTAESFVAERVREEKRKIAPGCSSCVSPCGNTGTYDMRLLADEPKNIKQLKEEIMEVLHQVAVKKYENGDKCDDVTFDILRQGILSVSYSLDEKTLLERKKKIEESVS